MPRVSEFFGIAVYMYWREHQPPHFHAQYGEYEALIEIQTLEIYDGQLPRRALALVLEWAQEHRNELMDDWNLCREGKHPLPIPPLE